MYNLISTCTSVSPSPQNITVGLKRESTMTSLRCSLLGSHLRFQCKIVSRIKSTSRNGLRKQNEIWNWLFQEDPLVDSPVHMGRMDPASAKPCYIRRSDFRAPASGTMYDGTKVTSTCSNGSTVEGAGQRTGGQENTSCVNKGVLTDGLLLRIDEGKFLWFQVSLSVLYLQQNMSQVATCGWLLLRHLEEESLGWRHS